MMGSQPSKILLKESLAALTAAQKSLMNVSFAKATEAKRAFNVDSERKDG